MAPLGGPSRAHQSLMEIFLKGGKENRNQNWRPQDVFPRERQQRWGQWCLSETVLSPPLSLSIIRVYNLQFHVGLRV